MTSKVSDVSLPRVLDVGCGKYKLVGSVGLDVVPLQGVDVVHDLNKFPYPFDDDSFDRVRLSHVIEHIQSITKTMEEIHRILRPGGELEITTPHYTDASSWQDPTHVWHLNSRSFDFFREDYKTGYYSTARFEIESSEVKLLKLYKWLGIEFLINLENLNPNYRFLRKFWEQYLCYLFRGKVMTFRLRSIK
jgi:predicted SAM-dependent methyltransferase